MVIYIMAGRPKIVRCIQSHINAVDILPLQVT